MIIPKNRGKHKHNEKLKEKKCQFPISDDEVCNKIFYGSGKSKYCIAHRDRKFVSIITKHNNKNKVKEKIKDSDNQYIEHQYNKEQPITFKCALEGCDNNFEVNLIPEQKIYPKYCSYHRNKYRRLLFIKQMEEYKNESKYSKVQSEQVFKLREGQIDGVLLDNNPDCNKSIETK